jgi:hypothetical protein
MPMSQRASRSPAAVPRAMRDGGPTDTAQASRSGNLVGPMCRFNIDRSSVTVSFAVPLRRPYIWPARIRGHIVCGQVGQVHMALATALRATSMNAWPCWRTRHGLGPRRAT